MLSNETKLERINSKLSKIGAKLEFTCYSFGTYTPILKNIRKPNHAWYEVDGIQFFLGVRPVGNHVELRIRGLEGVKFVSYLEYACYVRKLQEIFKIIEYCNNLGLEIPEYKNI